MSHCLVEKTRNSRITALRTIKLVHAAAALEPALENVFAFLGHASVKATPAHYLSHRANVAAFAG